MKTETPRKLALFIDADNLSPNDIETVFAYLKREGYDPVIRRAYGGHEKLSGMKEVLRKCAIRALVNQGKGTTDVSLTVDAMDLLHGSQLPSTVAIASSDADFAPLALRLREADVRVVCFASHLNSTPSALAIAYQEVVFVDEQEREEKEAAAQVGLDHITNAPIVRSLAAESVLPRLEKQNPATLTATSHGGKPPDSELQKPKTVVTEPSVVKKTIQVLDDPVIVSRILDVLTDWLPNTLKSLNQIGGPLRASGIAKGNKPLHELFRKHPSYFKVVPSTGPAKQIKLLKSPL